MIEKIKIRNFRSIKNLELNDLGHLNVFVGENNSGKSTVLNAIRIFNDLNFEPSKNDIRHGCDEFQITIVKSLDIYYYDRIHEMIRYTNVFDKFINYFERNGMKNRSRNTKIYKEEFRLFVNENYFQSKSIRKLGVRLSVHEDNTNMMVSKYDLVSSQYKAFHISIDSSNSFLLKAFLDSPAVVADERNFNNEVTGEPASITNSIFSLFLESINEFHEYNIDDIKEKSGEELSIGEINFLLSEKMSRTSQDFLSVINNKFNSYIDNDFTINWDFEENLRSRLRLETQFLNQDQKPVDFLSTGSGTRSLYILALLETYVEKSKDNQAKSGLFLIEEPELYLYPILERKMSLILRDISEKNQMFITTHSSSLVSEFELENIYLVQSKEEKQNQVSTYRKLVDLHELVDIIGFNSHPIFSGRYVFMVEGADDTKEYRSIIEKHFPNKVSSCKFIKVNSFKNIEVGVTCQFLKNTELVNRLFIITDSDGRKHEKIKNQYKEALKDVFSKAEIEDLFENRLYVTENAMNLECLSISYDLLREDELEKFNIDLNRFLEVDENKRKIYKQLNLVTRKNGKLFTEKEKEDIISVLESGSDAEKLEVLKKHIFVKNILKSFRNQVKQFEMISKLEVEVQKKLIPTLLVKLNSFFER